MHGSIMEHLNNSQRTAAGRTGLLGGNGDYVLAPNPLVVPGDAVAETARNIVAHQTQVRITVVCFLTYSLGVSFS